MWVLQNVNDTETQSGTPTTPISPEKLSVAKASPSRPFKAMQPNVELGVGKPRLIFTYGDFNSVTADSVTAVICITDWRIRLSSGSQGILEGHKTNWWYFPEYERYE